MRDRRVEGNQLSGWCSAAPGARIPHRGCVYDLCSCDCHEKAQRPGVETRQEGGAR